MTIPVIIGQLRAALADVDAQRSRIMAAIEALGGVPAATGFGAAATAPAVAKPAAHATKIWTAERCAVLRQHYPRGTPTQEIEAMVCALPGRPISAQSVMTKAWVLKLKRPASSRDRAPQQIAAPLAPIPAEPDTIAEWGQANGIVDMTLSAINAARAKHMLPPFVGGREPLVGGHNGSSLGDGASFD